MALPKRNPAVVAQVRTAFTLPACVGCGDAAVQGGLTQSPAEVRLMKEKFFEVREQDGAQKLVQKHWCCKKCWNTDPEVLALRADAASRSTVAERASAPEVSAADLPF